MDAIEVAEAIYEFTAESDFELSFQVGDKFDILDKEVGQGWWKAKNAKGDVGNIPKDFVKVVEPPKIERRDTIPTLVEDDPWTRSWVEKQASTDSHEASKPSADSDFDDDFDEEYSTSSGLYPNVNSVVEELPPPPPMEQHPSTKQFAAHPQQVPKTAPSQQSSIAGQPTRITNAANTLKAMLFDKSGLESYLVNGCKGNSIQSSEAVHKDSNGKLMWKPSEFGWDGGEYEITATNEASKLAGLKQFTVYQIAKTNNGKNVRSVSRRFKQFDWLHALLIDKFRIICIAGLPDKQVTGRFDQDFIEERKIQLELWLNRVACHPVLSSSQLVSTFLSMELQYNSNTSIKDWKRYKREAEKDPLRGPMWFSCIMADATVPLPEADIKVDGFMRFLGSFDRANFNLQNTVLKFNEFNGVMKREYQRVAGGFHELAKTFLADEGREKGSHELSKICQETCRSYTKIADSLSELASVPLHRMYYFLRQYSTMNSNFANVFGVQRELREVLPSIQQKNPRELGAATERAHAINAGVLAEINLLDCQRLKDYKMSLKQFLASQKKLYQEMANRIEKVEATINIDK